MNEHLQEFAEHAARIAEMTDMIFNQIRKLSELHDDGILTEEEFTAKKSELLSRL